MFAKYTADGSVKYESTVQTCWLMHHNSQSFHSACVSQLDMAYCTSVDSMS